MLRNVIVAAALALGLSACASPGAETESPAKSPESAAPPVPSVEYQTGFLAPERGSGQSWRWMGADGVIRLKNTQRDMTLTISGRAPLDLPQRPTITVELNGELLGAIAEARGALERKYDVPAAKLGIGPWSTLHITSSQTLVPHDINPESPDTRRLGFALYNLTWEPK